MHWFDISASVVMLLGGIRSYFRGPTQEVMSFIGWLAVFVFAVWGYVHFAPYLEPVIAMPWLRQVAGYVILAVVAGGAYWLWSKLVQHLLYRSVLSVPDRVLGGLFGIAKTGVLIAALCVLLIQVLPNQATPSLSGSRLAPPLLRAADMIASVLPDEVKNGFRRHSSRIRQQIGQDVSPPTPETASSSRSQDPKPSGDISTTDDRALRQLIKQHSN